MGELTEAEALTWCREQGAIIDYSDRTKATVRIVVGGNQCKADSLPEAVQKMQDKVKQAIEEFKEEQEELRRNQ